MSTDHKGSLAAQEDRRAMDRGDGMTGGVSLVSKFKVTNLVLVKDEELTVVHNGISIDLTGTGQTSHGLWVLAPRLFLGNFTVLLG